MPDVHIGRGACTHLADTLASCGKVALFHGRTSYQQSGAPTLIDPYLPAHTLRHSDIPANPTLESVYNSYQLVKDGGVELLLSVGGGSVMDTAKIVKALLAYNPSSIEDAAHYIQHVPSLPAPASPYHIAVPTTAGSGSEATHFAVCYIGEHKYSLAHPWLLPDMAIIDAALTDSMPAALTATTAFDALCQATESFWAVGATEESQGYARRAIEMIWPILIELVNHPTPILREHMSEAAHLAGKAINISKTTAPHALSYALSMRYGVSHGHAVALSLPRICAMSQALLSEHTVSDARGVDYVRRNFEILFGLFGCADAAHFTTQWDDALRRCGLATTLSEVGVTSAEQLQSLVAAVNVERLGNHPVALSAEDLAQAFALTSE